MLRESNCGVLEWLHAPIVYCACPDFVRGTPLPLPLPASTSAFLSFPLLPAEARALAATDVSWKAVAFHYLNQSRKHVDDYFAPHKGALVPHKKYLYVLRPLLCVLWLRAVAASAAASASASASAFASASASVPAVLSMPPAAWDALVARVPLSDAVRAALDALAARKRGAEALGTDARLTVLGTAPHCARLPVTALIAACRGLH